MCEILHYYQLVGGAGGQPDRAALITFLHLAHKAHSQVLLCLDQKQCVVYNLGGQPERGRGQAALAGLCTGVQTRTAGNILVWIYHGVLTVVKVLDEPTAGVDPVLRARLWSLLTALSRRGTTVLLTSHCTAEASRAHRVAFLRSPDNLQCVQQPCDRGGRLLADGSPADLLRVHETPSLDRLFLKLCQEQGAVQKLKDLMQCCSYV